jgi:hypothetical protein
MEPVNPCSPRASLPSGFAACSGYIDGDFSGISVAVHHTGKLLTSKIKRFSVSKLRHELSFPPLIH